MTRFRGFTLLEVLVAVAIFAILAALAFGGWISVMQQYDATHSMQTRLQEIRRAVMLLERDLFQIENRRVREAFQGDFLPALRGGVNDLLPIEFTRGGWRNPARVARSNLQRVAWQWEDGKLYRLYWQVLDQAQDSEPVRLEVLGEVEEFGLRFLDANGAWHEQWPPIDSLSPSAGPLDQEGRLPIAIEFIIELEDAGRIRRLVELPDA